MNPSDEVAAVGGPPAIGQPETVQLPGLPVPYLTERFLQTIRRGPAGP